MLAALIAVSGLVGVAAFAHDNENETETPEVTTTAAPEDNEGQPNNEGTATPVPNSVPIAENLELATYRGVPITGKFRATDPDGDLLTFEVTKEPKKGTLTFGENGEYIYTPAEKSKGKDSFVYVAVDDKGGISASATVAIEIKKQSGKTTYADMEGNPAQYAALVLAEEEILIGDKIGAVSFFRPDSTISRSEFLSLCMALNGTEPLSGITQTGFMDDAVTPTWAKSYISAGLLSGYIGGERLDDGTLVFSGSRAITYSEAAVILNSVLDITDVTSVGSFADDLIPAWAKTASVNLLSVNVLPNSLAVIGGETVTRAQAAEMLVSAMNVLEARKTGGLFGLFK
jgi:hypothetical protein